MIPPPLFYIPIFTVLYFCITRLLQRSSASPGYFNNPLHHPVILIILPPHPLIIIFLLPHPVILIISASTFSPLLPPFPVALCLLFYLPSNPFTHLDFQINQRQSPPFKSPSLCYLCVPWCLYDPLYLPLSFHFCCFFLQSFCLDYPWTPLSYISNTSLSSRFAQPLLISSCLTFLPSLDFSWLCNILLCLNIPPLPSLFLYKDLPIFSIVQVQSLCSSPSS